MTQTDTTTRSESQTTTADVEPTKRSFLELSFVQLCAGALAAMTAALIGSRLGVSGTVIGAAVGSLVAGITGSVYSASLQHGRQVIAKAPLAVKAAPTLVMRGRPTAVLPTAAAIPPGMPTQATLARREVGTEPASRRRAWKPVLATAAAMFALAGLGITVLELATGQSLSGREGTTISQVGSSGAAAPAQQPLDDAPDEIPTMEPDPTQVPSQTPSDAVETPDETPSEDPSETPSETPTEPTEVPSEDPSATPSPTSTDDPTADPTEEPSESPTATW